MNQECKQAGMDIAAKNQRVSVIRWSGRESTMTSKEKSSFKEDSTLPIHDSSCPVVNLSNDVAKYHCRFCGKSFKWHSHWKSHERTHTGEKPFECEMCGKSFARSDGLQCHKLTHISRIPSYFSRAGDLEGTSQGSVYTNAVPYKHPQAERESVSGQTSKKDISNQLEQEKLFTCHHCNRMFFSFSGMVKHMQVHKGRANFICEVCDRIFRKKSALEVHSRVHTGIKPYRCRICTKEFSIYGNLKRHLLIHTGERPYKCSQCLNRFNNPSHLARHLKTKHTTKIKN